MSGNYTLRFLRGLLIGTLLAYTFQSFACPPKAVAEEQQQLKAEILKQQQIIQELNLRLEQVEAKVQTHERYVDRAQSRSIQVVEDRVELNVLQEQIQKYEDQEAEKRERLEELLKGPK